MRDIQSIASSEAIEAAIAGKDFYTFVKRAWPICDPAPFLGNWHVEEICHHLELVSTGEIKRLVINVPPGSSKSRIVSVIWPAWDWIQNPTRKFQVFSYDISLLNQLSRYSLDILESPWYQRHYARGLWTLPKTRAVSAFENSAGGRRDSASFEGRITGRHSNIHIVDDPIKPKDVDGVKLEKVIDLWRNTLASRATDLGDLRKVIIMQRLHDRDLAGYVLEEEKNQGWVHLCFPMRFNSKRACYTNWGGDWRTEEGETLDKIRFPDDVIKLQEFNMGPMVAAAQLDQDPVPPGGAIFKEEWFVNRWEVLPHGGVYIQTWDCTFKDEKESDYVVGQVWYKHKANFYLVDQIRERLDFPATCAAITDTTKRYPQCSAILIEDKANGPAVISTLRRIVPGIVPILPQGSKLARAHSVTGLFLAGNIWIPKNATWVPVYIKEFLRFPRGQNDDQVDATTQGLTYLKPLLLGDSIQAELSTEFKRAFLGI